jgi:hypothetical protein
MAAEALVAVRVNAVAANRIAFAKKFMIFS